MDLREFTVLDEVGDEDAQVRNVDTHFKPSTAAEEIDYLNKILADIEKNAGSCKKYPGSGNNIEGQSLENNNSSDCKLLSDGNNEGTDNMGQNSFENGNHDELKPNSCASAEKKCGCDFDEQNAGIGNENKYIFQVKRCISQGFDLPHADDDVTQGYHVSTSNIDSGLLQSGLSTEPNLITADPVTKSDSNSTQNINACHSNQDADLGEDLEHNIGPISLAVLNESGSSELRPITTDGTTAVPINTSDYRSPVLESQHYSARDTSNNYLSGEDVSGLTDAKNSANELKFDSVIPGNTGNPLENSQEPGFAIQSTESNLFETKIDLALVKTEPVTVDPAEEYEFVGFMSDPAQDFRVKEEYKLKEEPTDFSSATFDQSVDLFPVKIFKSEDEFPDEQNVVHSVRFLVEDKHYSREQVTSALIISQSSLGPVIDMNMFRNVGKTTLALNLISLEDLIHSPSQVCLEDVEILSLFVKNYGSSFSEWKKIFKCKTTNKRKLAGPHRRASKKDSPRRKKSRRTEAYVKSSHLNEADDSLYCNNDGSDSRAKKCMEVLSNEKNKKKKKRRRHKSHTKQNKQIAKTEENLVKENSDDIKLVALHEDNSCASTGLAKISDFGGIQKQQVLPEEKGVEKTETEPRRSQCDTSSIEDYEVEAKPVNRLMLKGEENWVKVDLDDIKLKSYIEVLNQGNDNSCDSVFLGEESHCDGIQKQELHDQKDVSVQETNTQSPSHCKVLLNDDNFIKGEAKSGVITMPIISQDIIDNSVRKRHNSHQLVNAETEKNLVKLNSDDMKLIVLHHDVDKSCDPTGLDNGSEYDGTQKQELHNQKDVQKTDTQSPSHCAILPNEDKFIKGKVKSDVSNMTISPQWTMDDSLTSNFLDVPMTEENIFEKSCNMPCITLKHVEPPEKKAKKAIGRIILNDCKPCTVSLLDIAKDKKYKNIVDNYLKLLCKEIKTLTLPDLVKCEDKQIFACKSSGLPTSLRNDRALNIQPASKFTELDDHRKGEDENTMQSSSCSNKIVESEDESVHAEEEEGYNMGSNSDHNVDKSFELVAANENESLISGEENTDYNQDSCNSLVQEEFEKEKVYGNEIFTAASEKRGDCDKDNIYYVDKSLESEVETSVAADENREEKVKANKDAIDKELINKDKTQKGKMELTREEREKLKWREKRKSKQERTLEIRNTKKEPEDFKRFKREKTRVTENKIYHHTKWKQEKIREKEKKLKELEQKRKFAVRHGFSKLETIENDSISKENVAAACTSLPSITTFKIPKKKVVETRGSDGDKQNLVLSRRKEILGPGKVSSYYSRKTSGNDDKNRSFSREWNSYRKIDNRNPNRNVFESGVQTKQHIIEGWTKREASHISGRDTVVRGSPAAACSLNDNSGYGLKRLQHMPQMEQEKKMPYQVSSPSVMDKQCMSDYSAVRPEGRDLNMSNSLISEDQKVQCKPERKPETNVPPPPIVDNWGMMPNRSDVEITDDVLYAGEFSPAESSASPQESCHGIKELEPLEKNIELNVLSDNKNVSSEVREIKSSLAGSENAQKGPKDTNLTSVSGNKQIDNGTTVDKIRDVITVVNTVEERCRHMDKKQKMRLYEKVKRFYYEAKKRYHEEKGDKKQMKYVEYEKRKKEYYDLKIYLYEEKKREYEANKKNQKENLSKSRNVRQSSKPKGKGSKQILEPVSTLKTKTPQDNSEDTGCGNSEEEDPYSPTGSPILLDPEFSDINVRASLLDQTLPFVKRISFLEQSKQENEIKGTPADDSSELKHTSAPQTTGGNLRDSVPHKNYLPANGMSLGATSNPNITKLYDKVPGTPVIPSKSSVVVSPHDKSMPSASLLFPSPLVQNALPLPVPPPQPSSSQSSFSPQPLSKFASSVQNTQAGLTVSTTSSFPSVCGAPVSPSVNTDSLLPATPCDRVAAPSSPIVALPSSVGTVVVPIPSSSASSEAAAQSSKMLSCSYKKSGPSDIPLVSTVIKKQQQLSVDLVPPPLPPDKLFALVGYNLAVSEGGQNSTRDDTLEVPMDIESDSEICNNEGNDTEYLATFGICVDNPSVSEPQVCQTRADNSNKTGKSLKKVLIKLMETTKEKKLVKSSHRNEKEHEQKQEVKEVISNASENSLANTTTAGSQVIIPETSNSLNCLEINEEAVDANDLKVKIKETPKKLFCVDELLMSVEAADQQSELQVVFSNVQKSCSNKMLFRDEVPKYYQKTPLAQTLVDKCRGIPLVGLQYVLEVRQDVDMTLDGCYYICVICSKKMNTHTLIPHVKSVHHKLKFSEIHCRDIFLKYGSYSIKQWTAVLVKEFTIALSKVEAKMGRHKLAVAYEKDLSSVLTALKNKITEMSKLSKPVEKTVEEIGKDSWFKTSSCATGLSAESIPLPTSPKVSTIHKEIPLPSSPQVSTIHKEIPLPCSNKLSTNNLEIPLPSAILPNKTTCISKDESPLSRNNPEKKAAGSLNFSADKKDTNMKERNTEQLYWKNDGEKVIPTDEKTTDIEKFSSKGQGFRKRNYRPGPNSGYRSPSQSPVRSPLPKRNNSRSPSSKRRRKSSSPIGKKTKHSRSSPPKEESMHVYTGNRKRRQSKSPISPSNSRSASHSKGIPTHHRSSSQSRSRYRSRSRSRSRHRSPYRRNERRPQQSPLRNREAPREQNKLTTEAKLKAFKDSETRLKAQHINKQVLYDKQPETHPDYNREWKIFWERRCGELEEKGIDAFSHDFKSEWAIFWRQRIKELMTNEFKSRRYSLLRKFNMDDPDLELRKNFDSHKTDTRVNSSWNPVKKDTVSRIDRSPSPWEDERVSKSAKNPSPPKEVNMTQVDPPNTYEEEFSVIGTLKLLNELEDQLGSFGPAITILLDKAIEKTQNGGDAMDLFSDPDNFVLVRYAREKLSSQVSARILGVSVLVRTQMAVERAMWLQSEAEKFANKEKYLGLDITSIARATLGKDKIQVAQYIAQHLLNVGNSNASEEDLQNILIAVSATHAKNFIEQATKQAQDTPSNVSQSIYSSVAEPVHSSVAESVHNSVEPACTSAEPVHSSFAEPVCGSVAESPLREKPQKFSTLSDTSRSNKSLFPSAMSSNHTSSTSSDHDSSSKSLGLSMLQSAYEDETAKDMEKLSLEDLRSLLANFRSLSPEEQQALTTYLKKLEATDSNKVMKLREEMQKSAKSAGKKIMTPSNTNNSQKQSNELSRDSVASKDIQRPVTNPPTNQNAETISTRQTKSSMQNEPIIYNPRVNTGFSDSYPPENLHRAEPEREKPPTYQGSSKSPVGLTEGFREFESSHNQTTDSQNRLSFGGRPCTARDGSSFTLSSHYAQQRYSESFDKDFHGSDYNKHFGQGSSRSSIPEGPEGPPRYNKPGGVQDLPNYTPIHDRGYPSRGNQFQNNFNGQGEKNWYDGRPPPFGPPGQIQQSGYNNSRRERPPLGGPPGPHVPFQQPW